MQKDTFDKISSTLQCQKRHQEIRIRLEITFTPTGDFQNKKIRIFFGNFEKKLKTSFHSRIVLIHIKTPVCSQKVLFLIKIEGALMKANLKKVTWKKRSEQNSI